MTRTYHVIRIVYSDGKTNQRTFANKQIALLWRTAREKNPIGNERVIYAGTVKANDISARLMRKNERMALDRVRREMVYGCKNWQ